MFTLEEIPLSNFGKPCQPARSGVLKIHKNIFVSITASYPESTPMISTVLSPGPTGASIGNIRVTLYFIRFKMIYIYGWKIRENQQCQLFPVESSIVERLPIIPTRILSRKVRWLHKPEAIPEWYWLIFLLRGDEDISLSLPRRESRLKLHRKPSKRIVKRILLKQHCYWQLKTEIK